MLPQPIFNNRALSESFYQALVNRFHHSLNLATQTLLGECSYGMAPSPTGVKTFLIIAPSRLIAEQLVQEIHSILQRVSSLMAGVGQVAVCIAPPQEMVNRLNASEKPEPSPKVPPSHMACKIFPIPSEVDQETY
jgi:hypothetical protein